MIPVPAGRTFTAGEYKQLGLVMRTWPGKRTALRIGLRLIGARLTGKSLLAMGQALIGRLRLSLQKRDIPLWLDTPMGGATTVVASAIRPTSQTPISRPSTSRRPTPSRLSPGDAASKRPGGRGGDQNGVIRSDSSCRTRACAVRGRS